MADMLVKLYDLPAVDAGKLDEEGVSIRRIYASEKSILRKWVLDNFTQGWADECEVTFSSLPVTTFIAVKEGKIMGFASYNASCLGFFGPTGVGESVRGKGVGKALLLHVLHAMREAGYGYAVIGGVGPADFYSKAVGAVMIEGSSPGIYKDRL